MDDVREMWEVGDIRLPDSTSIVLIDDVLEMEFQCFLVGVGLGDSLRDLEDDGAEA